MRSVLGDADRRILRRASRIIGVDEVGRGSLAGPVVVGAVAWESIPENAGVQDSKRLSPGARESASAWIRARCAEWTLVEVWPGTIDRVGIASAVRLAMETAVETVAGTGSVAVADAMEIHPHGLDVISEVRADARYFSVASASIVAKVHRDRLMVELDGFYPHWLWRKNKGYGTVEHRQALSETGASFLHRHSFSWRPVLP